MKLMQFFFYHIQSTYLNLKYSFIFCFQSFIPSNHVTKTLYITDEIFFQLLNTDSVGNNFINGIMDKKILSKNILSVIYIMLVNLLVI